jgi:hypothetical protein
LKPGALLTVTKNGIQYPLLFLHLKSLSDPKGFGFRVDMTEKAVNFKKVLDKQRNQSGLTGKSNVIFLGYINTMGMNLTYSNKDVSGDEEIARLKKRLAAKSVQMKLLTKTPEGTYWLGTNSSYYISNLDHVVAADHFDFKKFSGEEVRISGWVDEPTDSNRDRWTEQYSDHALLYLVIQEPSDL